MNETHLFAFTCGTVSIKKRAAIDDGVGMLHMPIPAFLVTHPAGNVLFDTGLHRDLLDPASTRLGVLAKYMSVSFSPEEHILPRLAAVGLMPRDIAIIVNSHLHFDHVGGNDAFPEAKVVLQRSEWAAARDPALIPRLGYIPDDYARSNVVCVDGEQDLYGDGALTLIPTGGHTPGHQSLLVRIGERRILLVGDACYLCENLERRMVPRTSFNVAEALHALDHLTHLRRQGVEIIIGHDPQQWQLVPQAPAVIA